MLRHAWRRPRSASPGQITCVFCKPPGPRQQRQPLPSRLTSTEIEHAQRQSSREATPSRAGELNSTAILHRSCNLAGLREAGNNRRRGEEVSSLAAAGAAVVSGKRQAPAARAGAWCVVPMRPACRLLVRGLARQKGTGRGGGQRVRGGEGGKARRAGRRRRDLRGQDGKSPIANRQLEPGDIERRPSSSRQVVATTFARLFLCERAYVDTFSLSPPAAATAAAAAAGADAHPTTPRADPRRQGVRRGRGAGGMVVWAGRERRVPASATWCRRRRRWLGRAPDLTPRAAFPVPSSQFRACASFSSDSRAARDAAMSEKWCDDLRAAPQSGKIASSAPEQRPSSHHFPVTTQLQH